MTALPPNQQPSEQNHREKRVEEEKVVYLDLIERNRRRRLRFNNEAEMRAWEKAYRKSKLHMPYFLVGVGINLLLYYAGLDLGDSLFWGGLVGLAVPLATMFLLSELHYRLFMAEKGRGRTLTDKVSGVVNRWCAYLIRGGENEDRTNKPLPVSGSKKSKKSKR